MGGVVKYADLGTELNKALWRLFRKALRISLLKGENTCFARWGREEFSVLERIDQNNEDRFY